MSITAAPATVRMGERLDLTVHFENTSLCTPHSLRTRCGVSFFGETTMADPSGAPVKARGPITEDDFAGFDPDRGTLEAFLSRFADQPLAEQIGTNRVSCDGADATEHTVVLPPGGKRDEHEAIWLAGAGPQWHRPTIALDLKAGIDASPPFRYTSKWIDVGLEEDPGRVEGYQPAVRAAGTNPYMASWVRSHNARSGSIIGWPRYVDGSWVFVLTEAGGGRALLITTDHDTGAVIDVREVDESVALELDGRPDKTNAGSPSVLFHS